MTFSNRYGFPDAIAEALRRSDEDYDGRKEPGTWSVSELINPPMLCQLRRRHAGEIEEDVSEQAYRLLGTSLHYVVAKASGIKDVVHDEVICLARDIVHQAAGEEDAEPSVLKAALNIVDRSFHAIRARFLPPKDILFERRLSARVAGALVTGKPDLLDGDGWLNDYKVTSVWALLLSDKPEWEAQLNLYDLLCSANKIEVKKGLRIVAILRDWKRSEHMRDPQRYPDAPLRIKIINRWPKERQVTFLGERLAVHRAAEATEDVANIPVCTAAERWQGPDKWAVYKGANKRATKLCDDENAAYAFIAAQDPSASYRVECRQSTPTRCLGYCEVAQFCPFGKTLAPAADEGDVA